MDLLEELQSHAVLADGPVAAALAEIQHHAPDCVEELGASAPELVKQVHANYVAAGARVIRTNSFGGNAPRLARLGHGHRVGELNWLAAQLAREAAKSSGAMVAANVGPLEPSEALPREERRAIFEEQLGALLDGGARLVLLEAFTDLEELIAAVEAKHTLHHCPVIATIHCNADGRMQDGNSIGAAFARLREVDVDLCGISCSSTSAGKLARTALADSNEMLLAMFPLDLPDHARSAGEELSSSTSMAAIAPDLISSGVRLLGGGSAFGPAAIRATAERLGLLPDAP